MKYFTQENETEKMNDAAISSKKVLIAREQGDWAQKKEQKTSENLRNIV